MTEQRRRLADRLLASGISVAQQYAEQDRYDPHRPTLGQLVAETLAEHERIGEARVYDRIRALIAQREELREQRIAVAQRHLDARNLPPAASEFAWAAALDEQIGALRLLLVSSPELVSTPDPVPGPERLGQDEHA